MGPFFYSACRAWVWWAASWLLLFPASWAQAQSADFRVQEGRAQIYLLGEVHDNPHGHALRLAHIMKLIGQGLRPVLVMEQFDRENQAALDQALSTCADVDCVIAKAATPAWDWPLYKPLLQLALDQKVTLLAANVSSTDVRKVMRDGFSAVFSPALIGQYKLDAVPASLLSLQRRAIQEGHCNMLPPSAIGPMVNGQIARDVWMAKVIHESDAQTVVLIAGHGHVRKDAGVYQWLSPPKQRRAQVHGYVEGQRPSDRLWFDHVHLVPTIDREDPCQVFKQQRASQ